MTTHEPAYLVDHISIPVHDLTKTKALYAAALEPLGFGIVMESASAVGFGAASTPQDLWLNQGTSSASIHIGLHAEDEAAVHAFHAAGLAAGGTDNGQPGPRPQYHAGYYAAYLTDP